MRKLTLSRRALLRGAGAAVALPVLEAMTPRRARGQAPPPAPHRLFMFFVPNGIHMPAWTPTTTGTGYAMPPILQSLEPFRDDVTVVSGLHNAAAVGGVDGAGDHARGTGCFLTATRLQKTEGADIKNGVSVDQAAAEVLRGQTRFASIELGCEGGGSVGGCDSGYSCAYSNNIAWRAPQSPLPKEINPRSAFDRLFAGDDPTATAAQQSRRALYRLSVLDFVKDDAARLQARLGVTDRRKVDEYLTGVREIEQRVQQVQPAQVCTPGARPTGVPADTQGYVRAMLDLVATAFACDLTRVATLMLGNGGSNRTFPFLGIAGAHHQLSHHQNRPENFAALQTIDAWEVEQLAYLLGRLRAIDEGGASVLDRSLVLFSSEISDGNSHSHSNLPVVLAGRGGGAVTPGRHLRVPTGTPIADLFLAMLATVGPAPARFGDDGTAPLALA